MPLPINMFVKGLVITSGAIAGATVAGWYWIGPKQPEGPNENDGLNEKIKNLGISNGQCLLAKGKSFSECELNKGEIQSINFQEKGSESELTVEGMEGDKKMFLRIEKDHDTSKFPEGIRLIFTNKNTEEVSIGKDSMKTTFKKDLGRDYNIQTADNSKIMETWTLQKLGGMVGMTVDDSNDDTCKLAENDNNKVNVWRSEKEYVIGADLTTKGATCQMKVTKETVGYTEGFKFTVKDENDIALSGGTGPQGGTTITTIKKTGVSYEVAPRRINDQKIWFLIERNN